MKPEAQLFRNDLSEAQHLTEFSYRNRHRYVVCFFDGTLTRRDNLKRHCERQHGGEVRALQTGEQPLAPYCSNWLEVALSLGKVKPDRSLKDIEDGAACSLKKPKAKSNEEVSDDEAEEN